MEKYGTIGSHVMADLYGVENFKVLNSVKLLKEASKVAIELSGATLLKMHTHKFIPQGVTLTAIISESSLDLHTWPVERFIAISYYTCGEKANPLNGIEYFIDLLRPESFNVSQGARGHNSELNIKPIILEKKWTVKKS